MDIPREAIDKYNRACYDNRADCWDRFPFEGHLPRMIRDNYNPTLGNRVLDIGSGTGILALWMKEQGFDVLCLDPSPEMAGRSRRKGLETLETTIQEFQTKEKFSIILAILSLIHVPKKELPGEIEKIAGMLPKDGVLILGMIEGKTEGVEEGHTGYPRFFSKYTLSDLRRLTQPYFTETHSYTFKGPVEYHLISLKRK
jgi:2-polyprenyl-3-methyl-5-hydroxy-6-metoxy-1,4-benzoquinol methylase